MFLFCFQYTLMTKHCRWKPVGKKTEFSMKSRSLSPCYYTKGALTHHPEGAVVLAVGKPCALRGGLRLLRQPPDNATAPTGAAVIVCAIGQIPSLQPTLFFQPPAQTCHQQLCRRDGRASCPSIFSCRFSEEENHQRSW